MHYNYLRTTEYPGGLLYLFRILKHLGMNDIDTHFMLRIPDTFLDLNDNLQEAYIRLEILKQTDRI
jgi:hypothetical protein